MNTAKAEAEMAYSLQAAKVQARIKEEEMQVKVVERQQNIAIQEQEIQRLALLSVYLLVWLYPFTFFAQFLNQVGSFILINPTR